MNSLSVCKCGHEIAIHDEHTTGCRVALCSCVLYTGDKEYVEVSKRRYIVYRVSEACHAVLDQTIDTTLCYCPKSEYANIVVEALNLMSKIDKERLKISEMKVTV